MQDQMVDVANAGQTIVKTTPEKLTGVIINGTLATAIKLYDANTIAGATTPLATIASGTIVQDLDYVAELVNGFVVINGSAVQASTVLTSTSVEVTDGDTITIGTQVYRFKSTPLQAYDIKISGVADTTLGYIIKAINASGVGDGSDYFAGTLAHPLVTAGTVITSHHFAITAKNWGIVGNSIATTSTAAHLSFTGATMASGSEGTAFDITVKFSQGKSLS